MIDIDADGTLQRGATHSFHVKPFEGARLDPARSRSPASIPFIRCGPRSPSATRCSASSREIRQAVRTHGCKRAILVGHNAAFDLGF